MGDITDVYDGNDFNCNEVDPGNVSDPIPSDWYVAIADEAEMKETKAGDGYYLKLRFSTINDNPALNNRKVWANLNLRNKNAKAQEIAMRDLSAIGHAIGELKIGDSSEILNKPLKIKVAIKDDTQYGPSNVIKGYKPVNEKNEYKPVGGQTAPVAASPDAKQSPARPQAVTSGSTSVKKSTPPWVKGK